MNGPRGIAPTAHGLAFALGAVERFFVGWQFPAFALALLLLYKLLLAALLLVPSGSDGLGGFAEEFRIWCFGYDPATGRLQLVYVVTMLLEPVVFGAIVLTVWWQPLLAVVRERPALLWRPLAAAFAIVAAAGAALAGIYNTSHTATGALPFPAEALRTHMMAPAIDLTDQDGSRVTLDDLRGRVVLITATYATCGHTCPIILDQVKRVTAALTPAQRADFRVLSVTLDPERDSTEVLANLSRMQDLRKPTYHLLTGPAELVNRTLDQLNVARSRDPKTGVIDHANLFVLVDRRGTLAYRFTLGERQEHWLGEAIRLLLRES